MMEEVKSFIGLHYAEYKTFTMGWCFKHNIFYSEDAFQDTMLSLMLYTKEFIEDTIDHYVKVALINGQRKESERSYERYITHTSINEAIDVKVDDPYREFNTEKAKTLLWTLFNDMEYRTDSKYNGKETRQKHRKILKEHLKKRYTKYIRNADEDERQLREEKSKVFGRLKRKMRETYDTTFNKLVYKYDLFEKVEI